MTIARMSRHVLLMYGLFYICVYRYNRYYTERFRYKLIVIINMFHLAIFSYGFFIANKASTGSRF